MHHLLSQISSFSQTHDLYGPSLLLVTHDKAVVASSEKGLQELTDGGIWYENQREENNGNLKTVKRTASDSVQLHQSVASSYRLLSVLP